MRNIIITGGELFNKGAQAMTFIAVDEMKKRFPDHQIYVLSEMDLQRPKAEREKYNFNFMGWYPVKFAKCQSNFTLRMVCMIRNHNELEEAEAIYRNADLMLDISGYAIGSNWSVSNCNHYLDHLEFARAFNIPVYLMPQSFGPFEFTGEEGKKVDQRIAELFPTVKKICARERDGADALRGKYHLNNVVETVDLVVNNKGLNLTNIYRKIPEQALPVIDENSVAVIPNQRNCDTANEERTLEIYFYIINELLREEGKVYIVSHSESDRDICLKLKNAYANDDRVVLFEQELSCIEFNELVKQFRYIVASRFHSIVHAFKNGIPCIALGWAIKYQELMKQFGQEKYALDVRDDISEELIGKLINNMKLSYREESDTIKMKLAELQRKNVFDIIKL